MTKDSLKHAFKNSELITPGRKIRKIKKICRKLGGKPKDWKKIKGIDDKGREWHWYEKKGGGKYGVKPQGSHDPF